MEWKVMASSTVERVAYNASSMTLSVEFKNGGVYEYFDVPQQVYDDFLVAASPGGFLAQEIKPHYRYARA